MNKIIITACACACIASGVASASSSATRNHHTYLAFGFDGNTLLGIGKYFSHYDMGIYGRFVTTKFKNNTDGAKHNGFDIEAYFGRMWELRQSTSVEIGLSANYNKDTYPTYTHNADPDDDVFSKNLTDKSPCFNGYLSAGYDFNKNVSVDGSATLASYCMYNEAGTKYNTTHLLPGASVALRINI